MSTPKLMTIDSQAYLTLALTRIEYLEIPMDSSILSTLTAACNALPTQQVPTDKYSEFVEGFYESFDRYFVIGFRSALGL
jgi:hypothetical protein